MKSYKGAEVMKDNTRLALLEQSIGHINETMSRMEKRFDSLEKKVDQGFDKVDKRFDKVDQRLDKLDEKIEHVRGQSWSQFRWIIGSILALLGVVVSEVVKGHIT